MNGRDPRLAAAALAYAHRGWAVFPCRQRSKTPATSHGVLDATCDQLTVARWWSTDLAYNVAVATGAASGIVVVDVDGPAGHESLQDLQRRHGPLGDPLWAATGGGGWHAVYAHPGGRVGNRAGVAPGVDVRGDGGYIVAAPSVHPSGVRYRWHSRGRPGPIPAWLLRLIAPPPAPPPRTPVGGSPDRRLDGLARTVAAAPEGQRNTVLNWAAWQARELLDSAGRDTVTCTLLAAAAACGLPEGEARRTVASGLGQPQAVAS